MDWHGGVFGLATNRATGANIGLANSKACVRDRESTCGISPVRTRWTSFTKEPRFEFVQ